MKTLLTFCLLFCLSVLSYGQTASPIYDSMQGVSGAEKITNLAEVEADLGRFSNLSATTGILSTANAQTLNVTGNATVNGFNYTASPTLNGASSTESTSTSVVGGIWNGDFSEGEGFSSSSSSYVSFPGWMGRMAFGVTGSFSISNGILNLNATSSGAGRYIEVVSANNESGIIAIYPMLPSTTYKLSMRYKTSGIVPDGPGDGLSFTIIQQNSSGVDLITTRLGAYTTATDWTTVSMTFTSNSLTTRFNARALLYEATGTAWIDDIKLEQVTTHTNNSTTPTVAYPVITGVSSEFVDQQNTTQDGTYANIGNTGASNYWQKQTFTPTQQKLSAISFMKGSSVGSPTGNMIIEIRNPANAIIASVDVEKSTWDSYTNGNVYTIPVFALLDEDVANYSVVFHSDVSETAGNYYRIYWAATGSYSGGQQGYSTDNGSSWTLSGADLYFKTHYAENTRQITLTNSSTGTSTTVDWGDDGLPDGAVVDLYNGTMSWETGLTQPGIAKFFSLVYNSSGIYPAQPNYFGWYHLSGNSLYNNSSASLYLRIPCKYVKDVTTTFRLNGAASLATDLYYSFDKSTWKILAYAQNVGAAYYVSNNIESNGRDVYIKTLGNTSYGTGFQRIYNFAFTATLDTSAIAPLLLAAGSNTINQSVNGGSYKADVAIKSVSGGFQTTLNEANKQLTVLRNAPRSYLETPDKTTNAIVVDNDELVSISGPVQVNGATIMNASTTPAYDIALPYNSGGAIGSSWNTYSETKYKNIISDVTEASYASIASRLAGVQSKMVTRKIPDAVKAKFFDAEIEWVTDVVSVTEEMKTQVVEPVYEAVKLDSKVTLDSKATEDQLLTVEASPKIVSYVTKEVSVLRSPGEYPRQEFRGWKVRAGVDEATKKQLENLYLKPHPEPIADTAPEAYRVPEGFAWSKWIEESTLYHNWILPQIINELPKLRKRLEALEASK